MNKSLYLKLSFTNIRKNARFYIPYIITCIFSVSFFYIMYELSLNKGLENSSGAESLKIILAFGSIIIGIFASIFLFYTNSFLMKKRKKEFGLYNILGMEKKHISRILFYETIVIGLISMIVGILFGILFDKFVTLILCKILFFDIEIGFSISLTAILVTIILFACIFIAILISNLVRIRLSKPIELINGAKPGEKEPKSHWILAILGFICLGIGYYISITTENPLQVISLFLLAVILVIVGTYLLFLSGTITILKILRKNKKYYYKTNHFIGVSGMMYRMKQNAVGLANICVLSTMVLVMVSTTVSLFAGTGSAVNKFYPQDISVETYDSINSSDLDAKINDFISNNNISVKNKQTYDYLKLSLLRDGNDFSITDETAEYSGHAMIGCFISLDQYNALTGEQETLNKNQVLSCNSSNPLGNEANLFGEQYEVKKSLESFPTISDLETYATDVQYIVVSDNDVLLSLCNKDSVNQEICHHNSFDINGTSDEKLSIENEFTQQVLSDGEISSRVSLKEEMSRAIFSMYGIFMFLGVFLGILFLMATVLIIYYKQISEGYDDKERFLIMQKVGLSESEVKSSINSQVLTVFFLPIIIAIIHVIFSYSMTTRLLTLLQLTDTNLFLITTIISILVFIAIYALVYFFTSKLYYKIVKN